MPALDLIAGCECDGASTASIRLGGVMADCGAAAGGTAETDWHVYLNGQPIATGTQQVGCDCNADVQELVIDDVALLAHWQGDGTDDIDVEVTGFVAVGYIEVTVANAHSSLSQITLTGDETVLRGCGALGGGYVDAGAEAADLCDAGVSVTSESTVYTSVAGTDAVTYQAQDAQGNLAAPVARTVVVQGYEVAGFGNPLSALSPAGTPWDQVARPSKRVKAKGNLPLKLVQGCNGAPVSDPAAAAARGAAQRDPRVRRRERPGVDRAG